MEAAAPRAYHFDGFRVDLVRRHLLGADGQTVALSSRAYEALVHLIENRERVVSKDDLMKAVWPRAVVEENNLSQAISAVRRALADSRESPRYIATIAGRGYRFVGAVTVERDNPAPQPAPETIEPTARELAGASVPSEVVQRTAIDDSPSRPSRSRRWVLGGLGVGAAAVAGGIILSGRFRFSDRRPDSIAVLPFQPLLDDAGNPALEIGMADTLIARLSELPGMVVAPLSSVRSFGGRGQDPLSAGRALGVAAVLESHIQVQPERVRVIARLLDVGTGAAIWSGRFDERLDDFFTIQDAMAQQVADALEVGLSADSRRRLSRRDTDNVEAWQLYLNGRLNWGMRSEDGFRRAIELYDAALALDPNFALAAAGLADVWAVMGVFAMVPPANAFAQARAAAQRAIALDGQLAEAQAALGHVMVQGERDWKGGDRQYRIALKIRPTYGQAVFWMGNNQCYQGRIPEALMLVRQAQSLEPMSVPFAANVGLIQYFARQFNEAKERLSAIVATAPQYALARRYLVRVMLVRGEVREALTLLEGHEGDYVPGGLSDLGRALALDGQRDAARREISRLETLGKQGFGVGYDMALIGVALGETEQALAALERGVDDGSQGIGFLNSEPGLDAIRQEPRFKAVSRAVGLG